MAISLGVPYFQSQLKLLNWLNWLNCFKQADFWVLVSLEILRTVSKVGPALSSARGWLEEQSLRSTWAAIESLAVTVLLASCKKSALCQAHQVIPEISPQNHLHLHQGSFYCVPTCTNITGQIPVRCTTPKLQIVTVRCLEVQNLKVPWVAAAALQCWGWTSAFKASGDNMWQWYALGTRMNQESLGTLWWTLQLQTLKL